MIHYISYRTFVYGTEDEDKVMTCLGHLFSNPLPDRDVSEDYFGNPIIVLSGKVSKKRFIRDFISFLNSDLSLDDKELIRNELSRRVDDKGNLFLRFDKQLAYDGILKLTYSGDAVHLRIKIASYPVSKENAMNVAGDFFTFL